MAYLVRCIARLHSAEGFPTSPDELAAEVRGRLNCPAGHSFQQLSDMPRSYRNVFPRDSKVSTLLA